MARFAQNVEDRLILIPEGTEPEYLAIILTKLIGPPHRCTLEHNFNSVKTLSKRDSRQEEVCHIVKSKSRNYEFPKEKVCDSTSTGLVITYSGKVSGSL